MLMPNTRNAVSMTRSARSRRKRCSRLGAIIVRAATAGLLLAPVYGIALGADDNRHVQESFSRSDVGHHEARRDYYRQDRPEVGVLIAPETEHWRGNYVPDSYRLDDYDGVPSAPRRCSGSSGVTISTADVECPPGQAPSQGTRRWTTQP